MLLGRRSALKRSSLRSSGNRSRKQPRASCTYTTLICIGLALCIAHTLVSAFHDPPINLANALSLFDASIAGFMGETGKITKHAFQPGEPNQKSAKREWETESAEQGLTKDGVTTIDDADADCIFRNSPIYRKVYVYPNPGDNDWKGDILSQYGKNLTAMQWPWLELDQKARAKATAHYDINSPNVQYTTELLVRELMTNPKSCLRTYNPEEATLFYVPYLPSTEHHVAHNRKTDYSFSDYGRAIIQILDKQEYSMWEELFGMTSKYWKRHHGADHILVFSEPMHGLYHPRFKRGNFHFIHTQKQLKPPIVISVELSTTFVNMYPNCAAKNILVPYPNTHGNWFNGKFSAEATNVLIAANMTSVSTSEAALPVEQQQQQQLGRPVAQYYSAGNHGTCKQLRRAMRQDYNTCAPSAKYLEQKLSNSHNSVGMRVSTFCPCPGGDSPSAKRMFDALIAGCIPIILSEDFVWPFTKEFDTGLTLDPASFSIRLNASDYNTPMLDEQTCKPVDARRPGLQAYLESIPAAEIKRLRDGAEKAGQLYSWYSNDPNLPENPLLDGVLPDGGTAHFVVNALAERAQGSRWPACAEELKQPREEDPQKFKC